MNTNLDMDGIAKKLGAERRGKMTPRSGYFGALQLTAEVMARFRSSESVESESEPTGKEERLVRLSAKTLEHLEELANRTQTSPMQVAAMLLEHAAEMATSQQ